MDYGRENFLARQPPQAHVLPHFGTNSRERLGERYHVLIFGAVADLPETRMIPVLLASLCIPACGLDMPVRKWTDPHVTPRRWDGQGLLSAQGLHGPTASIHQRGCT